MDFSDGGKANAPSQHSSESHKRKVRKAIPARLLACRLHGHRTAALRIMHSLPAMQAVRGMATQCTSEVLARGVHTSHRQVLHSTSCSSHLA